MSDEALEAEVKDDTLHPYIHFGSVVLDIDVISSVRRVPNNDAWNIIVQTVDSYGHEREKICAFSDVSLEEADELLTLYAKYQMRHMNHDTFRNRVRKLFEARPQRALAEQIKLHRQSEFDGYLAALPVEAKDGESID